VSLLVDCFGVIDIGCLSRSTVPCFDAGLFGNAISVLHNVAFSIEVVSANGAEHELSEENDDAHHHHVPEADSENLSPNDLIDNLIAVDLGFLSHNSGKRRGCSEGEGSENVHDEIKPQELCCL